jgi:predicted phage-related endonuclease
MTLTEISIVAREYCEIKASMKQLEKRIETLKAELVDELVSRGVDTLNTGIYTIKWTPCSTTRIDSAALKKDLPCVFDKYVKESIAHRFKITE